jgi:hypothetical protein
MTKIQNPKPLFILGWEIIICFGHWVLVLEIYFRLTP